jgi:hypothetical protein
VDTLGEVRRAQRELVEGVRRVERRLHGLATALDDVRGGAAKSTPVEPVNSREHG